MSGTGEEFNSTFMFISWAIMIPCFFYYLHLVGRIKNMIYPKVVTESNKRKIFDGTATMLGIFIFLMAWGYALEWFYN